MNDLSLVIAPESPRDHDAVARLEQQAFGPGRFARTAYRLREGAAPDPALSFVARVGTFLVGSVRLTPVLCGDAPALLLGPLTVEPAFHSRGIGGTLIGTALAAAKEQGHALVILVGDEPYYRRFGFKRAPLGRLQMPGPVDAGRLLYCELQVDAFEAARGAVTQARRETQKPGA